MNYKTLLFIIVFNVGASDISPTATPITPSTAAQLLEMGQSALTVAKDAAFAAGAFVMRKLQDETPPLTRSYEFLEKFLTKPSQDTIQGACQDLIVYCKEERNYREKQRQFFKTLSTIPELCKYLNAEFSHKIFDGIHQRFEEESIPVKHDLERLLCHLQQDQSTKQIMLACLKHSELDLKNFEQKIDKDADVTDMLAICLHVTNLKEFESKPCENFETQMSQALHSDIRPLLQDSQPFGSTPRSSVDS